MGHLQVKWITREELPYVWEEASEKLSKSLVLADNEMTIEQLKEALDKDQQRLFVIQDDIVLGWMVLQIANFPNKKVLTVTHISGKGVAKEEGFRQLRNIAKSFGCVQIQIFCKEAQARLWRQTLGFKETYQVLRFDL